jgi:hypothetical protein
MIDLIWIGFDWRKYYIKLHELSDSFCAAAGAAGAEGEGEAEEAGETAASGLVWVWVAAVDESKSCTTFPGKHQQAKSANQLSK